MLHAEWERAAGAVVSSRVRKHAFLASRQWQLTRTYADTRRCRAHIALRRLRRAGAAAETCRLGGGMSSKPSANLAEESLLQFRAYITNENS